MLYGYDKSNETKEFHQRVADQNIQSIEDRQYEIEHAKKGFIGMLAGILVGGVVGWLFLSPADNLNKQKEIPVIRRPLTAAKVQPNEPGGMEIENQNREIYHIVDNLPSQTGEVNIIPVPEAPKLVIENSIQPPEDIENLVESIAEEGNISEVSAEISDQTKDDFKVADRELSAIKTNSNDKVVIPEKLKNVDIELQKTIKSGTETNNTAAKTVTKSVAQAEPSADVSTPKAAKGTWYTQLIASSSRQTVENLWQQMTAKHSFLKSYTHEVEAITAANGSTLYRLKVGAFKTRKEAEALSDKLKQNQISCIIKQN